MTLCKAYLCRASWQSVMQVLRQCLHWQRQSSVQVRESETGLEKVKENGFNAGSQVFESLVSKFSCCVASLNSKMECSGFCLCRLQLLRFGFVFYVLRSQNEFCLYVHLLTFWSNGWKFRNSLPISKSLKCGSAQGGNPKQGRFSGVEKCSKTLPRTKSLHSAGRPCLDVGVMHNRTIPHDCCCFLLFPAR